MLVGPENFRIRFLLPILGVKTPKTSPKI